MLKLKLQYFGEEPTLLKRPCCWERVKAGEGDDRGWDGWMASPTQWTWVWVDSGSWWWTGRPGVLRFMGSQRVGRDWMNVTKWLAWVLHQDVDSVKHSYPSSPKQDKLHGRQGDGIFSWEFTYPVPLLLWRKRRTDSRGIYQSDMTPNNSLIAVILLPVGQLVLIIGGFNSSIQTNTSWVFLVAQMIKKLPAVLETWVRLVDQEVPLKMEMAICSNILAWRIPWTEESGGL